jgi:hypothetical protein
MRLIKHDVTCREYLSSHRIEDVICLCTLGVADEDLGVTPVSELVDVAELLHKRSAAEHAQMVHCRIQSMLSLIRCATDKTLHQKPVL